MLVVEKFPGANTLEVTEGVEEALDELRPGLVRASRPTRPSSGPRPSSRTRSTTSRSRWSSPACCWRWSSPRFLFQWRTVLVSLVAHPGVARGGGARARPARARPSTRSRSRGSRSRSAVVIDDAVAGARTSRGACESTARRAATPRRRTIVLEASLEMRSPLAYATLIALLAIVPVAVMAGPARRLLRAAGARLRARGGGVDGGRTDPHAGAEPAALLRRAVARARSSTRCLRRLAPRSCRRARPVRRAGRGTVLVAAGGAAWSSALAVLPLLGTSSLPSFKDRDVLVHLDGTPGTSQPEMSRSRRWSVASCGPSRVSTTSAPTSAAPSAATRSSTSTRASSGSASTRGADYDATLAAIEDVVAACPASTRGRRPTRRRRSGTSGRSTRAPTRQRATASTC